MAHAVVLPSGAAPSPVALESRCLTVEPLDTTGWHAHRALDATEWHADCALGACARILMP